MKQLILSAGLIISLAFTAAAQRYGIVDTKYIMDKIPAYSEAQASLDKLSQQWQQEIDQKQAELDRLYRNFEAERVMLSEDLLKKREDELFMREKEVRDLQRQRFGFEGDLFNKRQELVKPVQDKVYASIQRIAANRQLDFILDKSEGITVIFADPKLDRSEDVLRDMGVK